MAGVCEGPLLLIPAMTASISTPQKKISLHLWQLRASKKERGRPVDDPAGVLT